MRVNYTIEDFKRRFHRVKIIKKCKINI